VADIRVAVINASSDGVLADAAVQTAVAALQKQVTVDFAPIWGRAADLIFIPKGGQPPAGAWWLAILDTSDQASVQGYHDLTSEGLPLGKVFAQSDMQTGNQWTATASHELLEMLGDPDINLWAFPHADARVYRRYAHEVSDASEAQALGYAIDGVLASDFLFPACFEPFWRSASLTFAKQGHANRSSEILRGGHSLAFDVSSATG